MKIVITGKNSYIGTNICKFLNSKGHLANTVSVRNGINDLTLDDVDVVIHCAAIVHKKEKQFANRYEAVNHKLTIDIAKKAKECGVKQFVFMSSMSVYGNVKDAISKYTSLSPTTLYGKTKLSAEGDLMALADDNFNITIIRPPMIYGKNCPGNYVRLSKLAKKAFIFPDTQNKKSMLYIVNLAFFVSSLIENNIGGTFMPMDNKYVSTAYMAKNINKKIRLSKALGSFVNLFPLSIIKKAFGSLYYDDSCATKIDYIDFETAIKYTEN